MATVVEVRGRRRGIAVLRQQAKNGEVAVKVKKPDHGPRNRNIAIIALAVAVVAIGMSVIATWIALGRVSQAAENRAQRSEEQSWCGIFQNLTTLHVPQHPDMQTQQLLQAFQQKYDSLHCPAGVPSAPPHH